MCFDSYCFALKSRYSYTEPSTRHLIWRETGKCIKCGVGPPEWRTTACNNLRIRKPKRKCNRCGRLTSRGLMYGPCGYRCGACADKYAQTITFH